MEGYFVTPAWLANAIKFKVYRQMPLGLFQMCHLTSKWIIYRHSVHGVKIGDRSDLQILHELEAQLVLDVWQYGTPGYRDALIRLSPDNSNTFLESLDKNGIVHYLHVADVAK